MLVVPLYFVLLSHIWQASCGAIADFNEISKDALEVSHCRPSIVSADTHG